MISILILSFIGPIISVTTDGYHIADFLPTYCISQPEVLFYAVILPIILISLTGIHLKLYVFLKILTNERNKVQLLYALSYEYLN